MAELILAELLTAVERGEAVALATVVETRRSVPRHAGSKMLVYRDGRTSGTIGGGEMESRVVTAALDALASRRTALLSYALVDPTAGDPGVCGGEVSIYVEPHMPTPTTLVIGCGHVGRAVADLAHWLGHRVVAWDDRPDLADGLEHADVAASGPLDELLASHPVTPDTSIVVVTRNVDLDLAVLPTLVATPARYVGVMGSARRWATTRGRLVEAGVAEADLDRVHAPIGIDIDAETPEEIAVSILAEVIQGPATSEPGGRDG